MEPFHFGPAPAPASQDGGSGSGSSSSSSSSPVVHNLLLKHCREWYWLYICLEKVISREARDADGTLISDFESGKILLEINFMLCTVCSKADDETKNDLHQWLKIIFKFWNTGSVANSIHCQWCGCAWCLRYYGSSFHIELKWIRIQEASHTGSVDQDPDSKIILIQKT